MEAAQNFLKKIPKIPGLSRKEPDRPRQLHTTESGSSKGVIVEGAALASREHPTVNQDAFFVLPDGRGFGVFDGMGSFQGSDVAARMSRDIVRQAMTAIPKDCSLEEARILMKEALEDAHKKILGRGEIDLTYKDMQTTATVGYVWEGQDGSRKLIVGHVGDSRMYRLRDGRLDHITLDDGEIARRFGGDPAKIREIQERISKASDPSELTQEEFDLWRKSKTVYNGLGRKAGMTATILDEDILPGDTYMVCSDGISDNSHDGILRSEIRRGATTRLKADGVLWTTDRLSMAPKNPWRKTPHDDATVVIAQFSGEASLAKEEQQMVTKV